MTEAGIQGQENEVENRQADTVIEDTVGAPEFGVVEMGSPGLTATTPDILDSSNHNVPVVEEYPQESDISELADLLEATLCIEEPPTPLPRRSTREKKKPDRYTPSRYGKIRQLMLLGDHFPYQRDLICGAIIDLIKVS